MKLLLLLSLLTSLAQADELTATFLQASTAPLNKPHDLKLSNDGRFLYVSDVGHNRVAILDPETLTLVGEFGSDHQSGTHDIDFDSAGRAYVADTHNNRVVFYQIDGHSARLLGELNKRIRGPEGVLVHPSGRVYVAAAWSNNVVAFKNGEVVAELKGLSSPHDLELAPDGENIWLSDSGNHRVLLVSPKLKIKDELSRASYDFNGVRYLDLLGDGTLVAADKNNHVIKFIGVNGDLRLVLGDGKSGKGPNKFTTPEGVEVKGSTLWLSDSGNNRIVKYRINGL
ncbi:MAG: DNA-binding beta-propeller fold protein YncE [Gammaproteobacteria bacterium]|jgi:DNA-binding beta-propeller fold protein YncE